MRQCTETFKSKKGLAEHEKTHRVQFTCDLCETEPFCSQARLEEHQCVAHEVPIKCPSCEKTFTRTDKRACHVKTVHGDRLPTCACACGKILGRADNLARHMEKCIIAPPGAAKAVKRRFEEISAKKPDDPEGAARQALDEITAAAEARLAKTCGSCGAPFANAKSLSRHQRKFGH